MVDLQEESRVDDRPILLAHGLGDALEERLVARVVLVPEPMLDGAGRVGGKKCLGDPDALERRLEGRELLLEGVVADIFERRHAIDLRPARPRAPEAAEAAAARPD